MTLTTTLDLLYLIIGIAVLWIAAMLTWLLFEAALAMRQMNRIIKGVSDKIRWFERTVESIGDRFESSSAYVNAFVKGGEAIARFIQDRRSASEDDEDEDEEEVPRKRSRRRR